MFLAWLLCIGRAQYSAIRGLMYWSRPLGGFSLSHCFSLCDGIGLYFLYFFLDAIRIVPGIWSYPGVGGERQILLGFTSQIDSITRSDEGLSRYNLCIIERRLRTRNELLFPPGSILHWSILSFPCYLLAFLHFFCCFFSWFQSCAPLLFIQEEKLLKKGGSLNLPI